MKRNLKIASVKKATFFLFLFKGSAATQLFSEAAQKSHKILSFVEDGLKAAKLSEFFFSVLSFRKI